MLAAEIEHYFVTAESRGYNPLIRNEQEKEAIKKHLRERLVERLKGNSKALAKGLVKAPPATLRWLVFGLEEIRAQRYVPFKRWPELVPPVLTALREEPEILGPQVAALLVKQDATRSHYLFDDDLAKVVFGKRVEDVVALFRGLRLEKKPAEVRAMIDVVASKAAATPTNPPKGDRTI